MKHQQSGFTLVEIAIVLVIVGLLLGGVLKGQELIASAKVKNIISDFNGISVMVYGYQDKFRAFPGDQNQLQLNNAFGATPINNTAPATPGPTAGLNNGRLDGNWNSASVPAASETELFWQHVRLANLASGATAANDPNYYPRTADGGLIGIESGLDAAGAATPFIAGMTGAFFVCANNIQGRYAKQIDINLDDGNTAAGSVRVVANDAMRGAAGRATATEIVDGTLYIVCRSY
jgi:prepilin-type N-terminal cleavage/methylation domain-containing protein